MKIVNVCTADLFNMVRVICATIGLDCAAEDLLLVKLSLHTSSSIFVATQSDALRRVVASNENAGLKVRLDIVRTETNSQHLALGRQTIDSDTTVIGIEDSLVFRDSVSSVSSSNSTRGMANSSLWVDAPAAQQINNVQAKVSDKLKTAVKQVDRSVHEVTAIPVSQNVALSPHMREHPGGQCMLPPLSRCHSRISAASDS